MNTRRNFLKTLGISGLALNLVPHTVWANSIAPYNYNKRYDGRVLRVAIMGLGSYGTRVAEAMKSCTRAKLVGVISGTPSKIKRWQSEYTIPEKNCYNYENFDNIKNNPDI